MNNSNNLQSRKWFITINNPLDCGLNHEAIIKILMQFSPHYFCMADEIAATGTFHTHAFIYSQSPIRFSTLKNRVPIAHLETAYGSAAQNREYIIKGGKWAETEKSETAIEGSFYEYGNLPSERAEKNPQMFQLVQLVKDGLSNVEIIELMPAMGFRIREIDALRQNMLSENNISNYRKLDVTYIFGATGTGKTRGIYEKHNAKDICRITNYRAGQGVLFDGYHGQHVLVFEEFASQIPIGNMLNYLDIYPLSLPARYNDKTACFTTVYITSNLPLRSQYIDIQMQQPEVWKAFMRRIHKIVEYSSDGAIMEPVNSQKGGNFYEHK